MTTGLFSICVPPEQVKPGMVMWAPEHGQPMTVKSIEPIAPRPGLKPNQLDYGWQIEYTERCSGRTWPRHQEIRIY